MNQQLNKFRQRLTDLLEKGVANGVYPGAVLLVAQKGQIIFVREAGNLSIIPSVMPMKKDTIFDLASLTKPLATALAIMKLVDDGRIDPDRTLSEIIRAEDLREKGSITLRSILSHCAGFRDWMPFYLELVNHHADKRKGLLRELIFKEPLRYPQRADCLYSDLGFMVLEWVVEVATGMSLKDFIHERVFGPMGLKRTFLLTGEPPFKKEEFAATEECPWRKRVIQGEVHDENAFALGGYSGHAGLFSTAGEVYMIADMLREHYYGKRRDYFSPGV
ncbi:MAG: serine hydrolase, partial [Deltaproteobacteria bacterium]|nr:serine hydrolase [Deltaproteobacteria bacterium]